MKQSVNLVPESFRRLIVAKRLMRSWTLVSMAVGASLLTYVLWEGETYRQVRGRRAVVESKARPFSEMKSAVERMMQEIAKMEESDALVKRLSRDQTPLLPLSLVSAGVKACPDQLWIRHVKFEQRPKGEKESEAKVPGPRVRNATEVSTGGYLTLEGYAVDNLAVAAFVAALRDTKGFRSVELKSSINSSSDESQRTIFTIESEL
jgi:Tfp pilus assembly protein PilN